MRSPRETIYNALAQSLKDFLVPDYLNSVSRVWRPHTDYTAAALGELGVCVIDETKEQNTEGPLAVAALYHLKVDVWLYIPSPQISQTPGAETVIPMTALNNLLDLLENEPAGPLANPPDSGMPYNTLGGLVIRTWIEGAILKVAGVANGNTPVSIARVPVTIFTT